MNLLPERCLDPFVEACLDPAFPLVVVVLDGVWAARENPLEAQLVAKLVTGAAQHVAARGRQAVRRRRGFFRDGVFLVSPHRAQIRVIQRELRQQRRWQTPPLVDTVDKMQGQEAEAVIVSYGVSDPEFAVAGGRVHLRLEPAERGGHAGPRQVRRVPAAAAAGRAAASAGPAGGRSRPGVHARIGPGRVAWRRGNRRLTWTTAPAPPCTGHGNAPSGRPADRWNRDEFERTVDEVPVASTARTGSRAGREPALLVSSAASDERAARARDVRPPPRLATRYRRPGRGRRPAGSGSCSTPAGNGVGSRFRQEAPPSGGPIAETRLPHLFAPRSPSSLLARLNEPQRNAACHGLEPLLIIAGAGTGKTTTLVHRVAHLISQGMPPDRMLLLTFTRRAAAQMLERVAAVLRQADVDRSVWGGTFHGIGPACCGSTAKRSASTRGSRSTTRATPKT